MAHVNLLPWRAERRKQREREFYMQLAAAFVIAVLVLLLWIFWMNQRIDNQNDRNAYLQTEIKQVDVRIAKIKDLEKVREHLLARKQIIEQLQADRSQMVHLLTALKQNGQSMTLDGVAQSNASVAEYMRNIEGSPWMGHVDLRKTENTHDATRMPYQFGLNVTLSRPKSDEIDADKVPVEPASSASSATPAVPAAPGAAVKGLTAPPAKPAAAAATAKPRPSSAPTRAAATKGGAGP